MLFWLSIASGLWLGWGHPVTMGLLFVFLLTLPSRFIAQKALEQAEGPEVLNVNVAESCPPHKWEYDSRGLLFCSICKKRPSLETRND